MFKAYKSDVLLCLADLSNDEVFTPPTVANQMLDLLPKEIWANPNIKILDPAVKSGVFLREAAKRMLNAQVPNFQKNLDEMEERKKDGKPLTQKQLQFQADLQSHINRIFTTQLYGLPITELTALLSRRSVYCSKDARNEHSVVQGFDNEMGNLLFFNDIHHEWQNDKCTLCGASAKTLDREESKEQHAYAFIHYPQLLKKWSEIKMMKFDVIIGNPPYQLSDGGAQASAKPIYHLFVEQAKKLNPDYLVMITPSRWFAGGKGLDNFRDEMLNDKRISTIVDYINSNDVFPGVDISGGISYFLWNKNHSGDCIVRSMERKEVLSEMKRPLKEKSVDTFVRYNEAISILRKVQQFEEDSFSILVSSRKPFGLDTNVFGEEKPDKENNIIFYTSKGIKYVGRKKIKQNQYAIDKYKVYISKAYGERISSNFWVIGKPFLGEPNTACTETYLLIGTFADKETCENVMSYIRTRFFRFLVLLKKNTQNSTRSVYQFVPQQDFSRAWSDKDLYEKYGLDKEEIAFIEKMVREMA